MTCTALPYPALHCVVLLPALHGAALPALPCNAMCSATTCPVLCYYLCGAVLCCAVWAVLCCAVLCCDTLRFAVLCYHKRCNLHCYMRCYMRRAALRY